MRVFTRKDNLREHLRAHAGQTKRKQLYKCEYCAEEFAGMLVLNQHKKYHLGNMNLLKIYFVDLISSLCRKKVMFLKFSKIRILHF